ncbi:MAG: septum formation inhibitor Maf [Gammaproteobacteria bacterium]|nr:septum formation inhibitor Maf [Gammaproteobacteria bacterium]
MTDQAISLVLASASPRRRELLANMGCTFSVLNCEVDESRNHDESADDYVTRMSEEKARAGMGALNITGNSIVAVLAADTIVTQGQSVFGKPRNQQHAFRMWRQLANSKHHVITAVCLTVRDKVEVRRVTSTVEFGSIDDHQMLRYWQTGEPRDKAGGYAIQGRASAWIKLIHGSYSNVVGLPLRETNELLQSVGHNWL